MVDKNLKLHNPLSTILIGELSDDVKIYPVKVNKGKRKQPTLFD